MKEKGAVNPIAHTHSWEGLYCPQDGVGSSERVRELEAELAERRKTSDYNYDFQELKARAEKAEKALEIAEAQVYRWSAGQRDTEQRLADSEARVAELETDVKVLELIGESQAAGPRRAAEIEVELAKIEAARKSKGAP